MNVNDYRTNYARASAGYDDAFRKHLADAICKAIAETSLISDASLIVLRTVESRDALVDVLITIMGLSPFYDTPSRLREFAEHLAKKVKRDVARLRADPPREAETLFGFRSDGGRA
jgi:hypothetical protein